MVKKPKPEPDDTEQSRRFVETAHKVEADESGSAFDRALGIVVKSKSSIKPAVDRARPSGKRSSS